jgi:hypothetical protein
MIIGAGFRSVSNAEMLVVLALVMFVFFRLLRKPK